MFGTIVTAIAAAGLCLAQSETSTALRTQVRTVSGGGELITYFQAIPGAGTADVEMPLLSVLRDTMGDSDPANDRLRQVWVFTYRRPSIWRRTLGAVPFLYMRPPLPDGNAAKPAPPVLDMGAPSSGMWKRVAGSAVQSQILDPFGWTVRLVTRSYGSNVGEYRRMHVWQALDVLGESATSEQAGPGLTRDETRMLQGRLELADRTFGGLVSDEYLDQAFEKSRNRRLQTRQANWDLLRQRAEDNGLYFQPISLAGLPVSWAMLWVAETDVQARRDFDPKFLGIANPFGDSHLLDFSGYTETWLLDQYGARAADGTEGARPVRMIPLALYALDHSRSPLLIADLRRALGPKRAEVAKRLTADVTTGVLGLTGFGNWSFYAAKATYSFVRSRHGSPLDRSSRLRAYVQAQHALAADRTMNPALRAELARRVDGLNVNPLERDWAREVQSANLQYEGFFRYAFASDGLARQLERNRSDEAFRDAHSTGTRALFGLARFPTLGLYRHTEKLSPATFSEVGGRRRESWLRRQAVSLPPDRATLAFAPAAPAGKSAEPAAQPVLPQ